MSLDTFRPWRGCRKAMFLIWQFSRSMILWRFDGHFEECVDIWLGRKRPLGSSVVMLRGWLRWCFDLIGLNMPQVLSVSWLQVSSRFCFGSADHFVALSSHAKLTSGQNNKIRHQNTPRAPRQLSCGVCAAAQLIEVTLAFLIVLYRTPCIFLCALSCPKPSDEVTPLQKRSSYRDSFVAQYLTEK